MNNTFTLTDDQATALDEIRIWLGNRNPGAFFNDLDEDEAEAYKVLQGYAGTGKTTLLNEVVRLAVSNGFKTIVTATTNKAVKVLREHIHHDSMSTIHSLLNIKPKQVGTKEIFEPDRYNMSDPLSYYDLVIVDEASMISEQLLSYIHKENVGGSTKVLFCGDPAQLQPINEDISLCFKYDPSTLSTIVRHGDNIANKAKLVRGSTELIDLNTLLVDPDIVQVRRPDVWELFKGFRDDPDRIRMLCWTNAQAKYWNNMLRMADYGHRHLEPFVAGDIVIANSPCLTDETVIMENSAEARVERVDDRKTYHLLTVRLTTGDQRELRVMKKEYEKKVSERLDLLAAIPMWTKYWSLRKFYHDIRHCYALTTHKSQGSTFQNVVLDSENINANRDIQNRNQLIYVAMTRAAEKVMIL